MSLTFILNISSIRALYAGKLDWQLYDTALLFVYQRTQNQWSSIGFDGFRSLGFSVEESCWMWTVKISPRSHICNTTILRTEMSDSSPSTFLYFSFSAFLRIDIFNCNSIRFYYLAKDPFTNLSTLTWEKKVQTEMRTCGEKLWSYTVFSAKSTS